MGEPSHFVAEVEHLVLYHGHASWAPQVSLPRRGEARVS